MNMNKCTCRRRVVSVDVLVLKNYTHVCLLACWWSDVPHDCMYGICLLGCDEQIKSEAVECVVAAPTETNPAAPTKANPAAPTEANPAAPTEANPAVPTEANPAASTEANPAASTEANRDAIKPLKRPTPMPSIDAKPSKQVLVQPHALAAHSCVRVLLELLQLY